MSERHYVPMTQPGEAMSIDRLDWLKWSQTSIVYPTTVDRELREALSEIDRLRVRMAEVEDNLRLTQEALDRERRSHLDSMETYQERIAKLEADRKRDNP